jgi:hypothetical protein
MACHADKPLSWQRLFWRLLLLKINWARRNNCRDGVLVDHLSYGIFEQYNVLIK